MSVINVLPPQAICIIEPGATEQDIEYTCANTFSMTHYTSGWTITGRLGMDWYIWVDRFIAQHGALGVVAGTTAGITHFTNRDTLRHFLAHHKLMELDFDDL